jgi:hypothetical protein
LTFTLPGAIGLTTFEGENAHDPRLNFIGCSSGVVHVKQTYADAVRFTRGRKSSVKPLPDGALSGLAVVPAGALKTLTDFTPVSPVNIRVPCVAPLGIALISTLIPVVVSRAAFAGPVMASKDAATAVQSLFMAVSIPPSLALSS